jgi:putative DNA primase/helicase
MARVTRSRAPAASARRRPTKTRSEPGGRNGLKPWSAWRLAIRPSATPMAMTCRHHTSGCSSWTSTRAPTMRRARSGRLQQLKRDTEGQIGCALPESLTAMTPSDGAHLYLLQADDGEPITNRGNLPQHVDVRGLGGYVIAAPSVMAPDAAKGQGGLRYRWHRREPAGGIADAPSRLLIVLRDRAGPRPKDPPPDRAGAGRARAFRHRRRRRPQICAFGAGQRMRSDAVSGRRAAQQSAEHQRPEAGVAGRRRRFGRHGGPRPAWKRRRATCGLDPAEIQATVDSGWNAGMASPRDLRDIEAAATRPRWPPHGRQFSRVPAWKPGAFVPSGQGRGGAAAGSGRSGTDRRATSCG